MVNEIPMELFIVMLFIDAAFITGAFLIKKSEYHIGVICSVFATIFSFVLSHSILNGSVYILKNNDTLQSVQSLPIFYLLEGISIFLVIYTAILIYTAIKEGFEEHSVFEGMTED